MHKLNKVPKYIYSIQKISVYHRWRCCRWHEAGYLPLTPPAGWRSSLWAWRPPADRTAVSSAQDNPAVSGGKRREASRDLWSFYGGPYLPVKEKQGWKLSLMKSRRLSSIALQVRKEISHVRMISHCCKEQLPNIYQKLSFRIYVVCAAFVLIKPASHKDAIIVMLKWCCSFQGDFVQIVVPLLDKNSSKTDYSKILLQT